MVKIEKRNHHRVDGINLINYFCIDQNNRITSQGMGRTLNLSESGLLVETPRFIDPKHIVFLNIGLKNKLVNINGEVVYSRSGADISFQSGIHFLQAEQAAYTELRTYIDTIKKRPASVPEFIPPQKDRPALPFITGPSVDYLYVLMEETFHNGENIVEEGKYGTWVWVVLEGAVDIVKQTSKGPYKILRLGPGSFIGNITSFLLRNYARTATAKAVGKVQLGLLDTRRLANEYAHMSPVFKRFLISLNKRLKLVTDNFIALRMNDENLPQPLKDRAPIALPKSDPPQTYFIKNGAGILSLPTPVGSWPIAELGKGDFVGKIPFVDLGQEPADAHIVSPAGFSVTSVPTTALQAAHHRLSISFQNIIENVANCTKATTRMIKEQMEATH